MLVVAKCDSPKYAYFGFLNSCSSHHQVKDINIRDVIWRGGASPTPPLFLHCVSGTTLKSNILLEKMVRKVRLGDD
jgi:hypothetical protein